jgi:hypothetical protein
MIRQIDMTAWEKTHHDEIDVTSRLLNIILEMPAEQQRDLLEKLDAIGSSRSRGHARQYLKRPWKVLIHSEKTRASYKCFIRDISRGGMFVEAPQSFNVGEKITLKFLMPGGGKQYQILGEIVRFQEKGIGIKFKRLLADH